MFSGLTDDPTVLRATIVVFFTPSFITQEFQLFVVNHVFNENEKHIK